MVFISCLPLGSANAAGSDKCAFVPRAQINDMMGNLPSNVIGWMNCYSWRPTIGLFLVVKLEDSGLDQQAYLLNHAMEIVENGVVNTVTKKSDLGRGVRELMVETMREKEESNLLYSFTAPTKSFGPILFIHNRSASITKKNWVNITGARSLITDPKVIEKILETDAKSRDPANQLAGR